MKHLFILSLLVIALVAGNYSMAMAASSYDARIPEYTRGANPSGYNYTTGYTNRAGYRPVQQRTYNTSANTVNTSARDQYDQAYYDELYEYNRAAYRLDEKYYRKANWINLAQIFGPIIGEAIEFVGDWINYSKQEKELNVQIEDLEYDYYNSLKESDIERLCTEDDGSYNYSLEKQIIKKKNSL